MIQARLIREKTAQLDLEVEESRKVPVSFWFPDNIQTFVLQNHKTAKIQPGKKISSFPTFCAGKTYHGPKDSDRAPPSLILGIVHFLLMRWSSSYSWSSSSLVAIEQIVSDCSRSSRSSRSSISSRSSPYSWSSRAWSQSSKLFLIARGGNSSLGSAFSMGLEPFQLFCFKPTTHCTIVIVTGADS